MLGWKDCGHLLGKRSRWSLQDHVSTAARLFSARHGDTRCKMFVLFYVIGDALDLTRFGLLISGSESSCCGVGTVCVAGL